MYDIKKAERAVKFISLLKATKGKMANKPLVLAPFQKKIIRDIYGTVRENGERQYEEAFILIPRKNGKSELIAGFLLYQLFMNNEFGQEIYSCANSKDQAEIIFRICSQMIRSNKALSKRCKIIDSLQRIVRADTNSFYEAISSDAPTKHGLNATFVVYDEIHESKKRDLYDVMHTSTGARTEPLFITITTAGESEEGIWFELYTHAKNVLNGTIEDDTFYPVIFELENDCDWKEIGEPAEYNDDGEEISAPTGWYRANPALGHFKYLERMLADFKKAISMPAFEANFRRLHLNQIISSSQAWINKELWLACNGEIDTKSLVKKECFGAFDLSSTGDLTSFVLVFPVEIKNVTYYVVMPFFFIPKANIKQRVEKDRVPYDVWERQGLIKTTPGNWVDYQYIYEKVISLSKVYKIKEIAYDPWHASEISQKLEAEGFTMVEFRQGYRSMTPACQDLLNTTMSNRIIHGNHPVLNWNSSNMIFEMDAAGNIKPSKKESREKIDGMVALIMALDRAIKGHKKKSVYESRGLRTV